MSTRSKKSPIVKATVITPDSAMEDTLKTILSELAGIRAKLDKVDSMEAKLDGMKLQLDGIGRENVELKRENQVLKVEIGKKDEEIFHLQSGLDSVERHQRAWSVRILGVPLTAGEEKDAMLTMKKIYDVLFLPILRGAVTEKAISSVPSYDEIFETAHVLPGKSGAHKPIIARFYNRNIKSLCFRFRKNYAPRHYAPPSTEAGGAAGGRPRGAGADRREGENMRMTFPFFDDLTKPALNKMKELQAHRGVESCWSINGQLRVKCKDSSVIRKVHSVFDSVDNILK